MMTNPVKCPTCQSDYPYQDGNLWICPECAHEWSEQDQGAQDGSSEAQEGQGEVRDANGTVLATGDVVTVIKDLKIKGAAATIKSGTKVKNIRLVDGPDGHNIACKIDGIGAINLKSIYVRKALSS